MPYFDFIFAYAKNANILTTTTNHERIKIRIGAGIVVFPQGKERHNSMIVRTVDRALMMLEAFAECGAPMTLSELARHLRMPTSTCFGVMRTLQARGYLYEVGGRKTFYPTSRWLAMGRKIERNDPVQEHLQAFLQKLRDATGESIVLSKRLGDTVVYLNVLESQQTVRYSAAVGDLKPLHSTSSGKALLGALAEPERAQVIDRLRSAGGTGGRLSVAQRSQLAEEIKLGAKRGWYVGRGENVMDVMGVAAPIYVSDEAFSIAIAGPMVRVEPKLHVRAKQLVWTCKELLKR